MAKHNCTWKVRSGRRPIIVTRLISSHSRALKISLFLASFLSKEALSHSHYMCGRELSDSLKEKIHNDPNRNFDPCGIQRASFLGTASPTSIK